MAGTQPRINIVYFGNDGSENVEEDGESGGEVGESDEEEDPLKHVVFS